jgi:hypothetical protein
MLQLVEGSPGYSTCATMATFERILGKPVRLEAAAMPAERRALAPAKGQANGNRRIRARRTITRPQKQVNT